MSLPLVLRDSLLQGRIVLFKRALPKAEPPTHQAVVLSKTARREDVRQEIALTPRALQAIGLQLDAPIPRAPQAIVPQALALIPRAPQEIGR